jgi:ABC-2 type transport system permease protein
MAGNNAFIMVNERGWRRGFGNMLRSEMGHWWQTRRWWMNILIWSGSLILIIGGMTFGKTTEPVTPDAIAMVYGIFAGMIPAVSMIIMMQGAVVGEKNSGTAAWVLSKPVTRPAFILSKLIANSLGMLVTMVIVPGVVAYLLVSVGTGAPWKFPGFLASLGVVFLAIFYFLSLTLMLGTLFNSRGPVMGISLGLLLMQQFIVGGLPLLGKLLPWNLLIPIREPVDAVVPCLLTGSNNYSILPIIAVALQSIIFVLVAIYRFTREEF